MITEPFKRSCIPFGIASFICSRFLGILAFFLLPTLVNIYNKIYLGEVLGFLAFFPLAMSVLVSLQWLLYHNAKQVRERVCIFCNSHLCAGVSISLALNSLSKLCPQIVYHQLSIHSIIIIV